MTHRLSRRLCFVAILAGLIGADACAPSPLRRFVVLIIMDTVRRDALGCYGNPLQPTPHIDALAADGVRFNRAISSSGWTLPAVASLLSGTWPSIHGALGRGDQVTPVRPEITMLTETMKSAGYRTAGFASAAFVSPMLGIDRGFELFDHEYSFNQGARRANQTMDAALEYARDNRSRDCFMMIHVFDPHLDYDPPEAYRTRFTGARSEPAPPLGMEACLSLERGGGDEPPAADDVSYVNGVYLGEVAFVDSEIGRFVAELKELDLYDRAMIVVTSDHGEEFWDHGGFEHGHTLYEELVDVPLIIKFPSDVHPVSRKIPWQVRTVDVMPTVLDYLGIPVASRCDGQSLMEFVRGEPRGHRSAFSESLLYGTRRVAWRTAGYTYIQDVEAGRDRVGELYDWRADPGERNDLRKALPEVAGRMRSECIDFYGRVLEDARNMSQLEPVEMGPEDVERLRSLGYIR